MGEMDLAIHGHFNITWVAASHPYRYHELKWLLALILTYNNLLNN